MLKRLLALLLATDQEPKLLDHVEVHPFDPVTYNPSMELRAPLVLRRTNAEKLMDAAAKFGKPFKCAAKDMDREVMVVPGEVHPVNAGRSPTTKAEVPDGEKEYGSWGVGLSEPRGDVARIVRSLRAAGRP